MKTLSNTPASLPLLKPTAAGTPVRFKGIGITVLLVLASNLITHSLLKITPTSKANTTSSSESLYLLDKAAIYVKAPAKFEQKVRAISQKLDVPPEWLMAVMYTESRFDAKVKNRRGSGAVGLIQWMPITAKEHNLSSSEIQNLSHIEQLDYVYTYLKTVQERYGSFSTLTDLYLGILYPKAIGNDHCFSLFEKPSLAYKLNKGLDENKDGRVSISDIDKRMKRLYPTAYYIGIEKEATPIR